MKIGLKGSQLGVQPKTILESFEGIHAPVIPSPRTSLRKSIRAGYLSNLGNIGCGAPAFIFSIAVECGVGEGIGIGIAMGVDLLCRLARGKDAARLDYLLRFFCELKGSL